MTEEIRSEAEVHRHNLEVADDRARRQTAIERTVGDRCPGCGGFGAVPALNDAGDGLMDIPCPICTQGGKA